MNKYPEIKVPSYLLQDNSKMTLDDVKNYFNWFLSIKNDRLHIFNQEVFKRNEIDFSANNLYGIYYFLKDNLAIRQLEPHKVKELEEKLPFHLQSAEDVIKFEFVEPSFTIIFDLSIYIGEMLLNEVNNIKWDYENDFEVVNYGYPRLIKIDKKKGGFSPYWNLMILAGQIIRGEATEEKLINLYNKWKDDFLGKKIDYLAMVEKWSKGKK